VGFLLAINIPVPILTQHLYDRILTLPTRQYIETGTYHGDGIQRVIDLYDRIHSIELSEKYALETAKKFLQDSKVTIYHGNSKEVLPLLLETIPEPVTIFLDGHYSGGDTAIGDEIVDGFSSAPLLQELEIIMNRPYDDIVIIDDVRMFGFRGRLNYGTASEKWPDYDFDWTEINEASIRDRLKPGYEIFKNQNQNYTISPNQDQWILARPRPL
jgi:hypothetical protein